MRPRGKIEIGLRLAGLFCWYNDNWAVHSLVKPSYWKFFRSWEDCHQCILENFGLGPFLLVCWVPEEDNDDAKI